MARRDQYIRSKTDFVFRKKHAVTNTGTIYENDHMTIVPDDDIFNDDVAMFSDSNFKFRVRTDSNLKKRHFSGNWIGPNDSDMEVWTGENCSGMPTTESRIELKPNYTSVKDFAYYGSAQKLIEATVRDILLRYPGGICFLGDLAGDNDRIIISRKAYVRISNEFDIDVWTKGVSEESVENPMRVLIASFDKYVYGEEGEPITAVTITNMNNGCPNSIIAKTNINGKITIYTYLKDTGERVLLVDLATHNRYGRGIPIIRVNDKLFEQMYDALDDFEKVLLNRKSKPMFKAELETPRLTEDGYITSVKEYIWPSISDENNKFYTPDLSSTRFIAYIGRLQEMATFLDEYDSDNIWRMMTHTSLKNLDWTFKVTNEEDTIDLSEFDSSRLHAALHLYGRQFDDIKRYADNIKHTNAITYNEKSNVPDYFLTDTAENDGWEAYDVSPNDDNDIATDVLYSGSTFSGYSSSDANVSFMRRLALNSDYIQSLKGTKRGIGVILSMFGMESGTSTGCYSIKEYVAIADAFPTIEEVTSKVSYIDDFYYDDDILIKWPITRVFTGDTEYDGYVVPWFDKNKKYDSGLYFQGLGGWEGMETKKINLPITSFDTISSTNDVSLYGETFQYMKYAENLNELTALTTTKLFENVVCYVEDITPLASDGYSMSPEDATYDSPVFSHYFILKTVDLAPHVGFVDNEYYHCYGWRNVFVSEFNGDSGLTEDGLRVLYAESIKTVENGNNPHAGYGNYDSGETYLEYFRQIFKYELDERKFSMLNDVDDEETLEEISFIGFGDCNRVEDSSKCHSFFDTRDEHVIELINPSVNAGTDNILGEPSTTLLDENDYVLGDGPCGATDGECREVGPCEIDACTRHVCTDCTDLCIDCFDICSSDGCVRDTCQPDICIDCISDGPTPPGPTYEFLSQTSADPDLDVMESVSEYDSYETPEEGVAKYDECAAFSVINVKNIDVNFVTGGNPYLKEYIENVVLKYLEQMMPSTAIFNYTFDAE